jgi:hypothetical protein
VHDARGVGIGEFDAAGGGESSGHDARRRGSESSCEIRSTKHEIRNKFK